jgi:tetratricopeptide (TPR) repeat protein
MRRGGLLLAILSLTLLGTGVWAQSEEVLRDRIRQAVQEGSPTRANLFLERLEQQYPERARAGREFLYSLWLEKAVSHQDWDQAIQIVQNLQQISPENRDKLTAYLNELQARRQGETEGTVSTPPALLAQAAPNSTDAPSSPTPIINVEQVFLQIQNKLNAEDLNGALTDLNNLINYRPDLISAYLQRGALQWRLSRVEAALEDWSTVLNLEANNLQALNNRAVAHLTLGNLSEAIADLDQLIREAPQFPGAHYNRSLVHSRMENYEAALADISVALDQEAENAEVIQLRGITRYLLGDQEGALADLNQALELDPNRASALQNRGYVRVESEDMEGQADLQKALEMALEGDQLDLYQQVLEYQQQVAARSEHGGETSP